MVEGGDGWWVVWCWVGVGGVVMRSRVMVCLPL